MIQQPSAFLRLTGSVIALAFLGAPLGAETANISIDATKVIRDVPVGLKSAFPVSWNQFAPHPRPGVVRIAAYPEDVPSTVTPVTLSDLDIRVARILNAGGTPLFVQAINDVGRAYSDNRDASVHARYLTLNGKPYSRDSSVSTPQRIATNMAYLVRRYRAAPFNLTTQFWEVGNEPDLENVSYRVQDSSEYVTVFQAIHEKLGTLDLRGNVVLCGPAVSWDQGSDGFRDTLMQDFLAACGNQVDVVTRHVYGLVPSSGSPDTAAYDLLNGSMALGHFDNNESANRSVGRLLGEMNNRGVPSVVGTGVTSANLFPQGSPPEIAQSLWSLLAQHHALHNPRSRLTSSIQFGEQEERVGGLTVMSRNRPDWPGYIHCLLTGDQILASTSSDNHLVVTASKDARHVYVQVLNRHDSATYTTSVTLNNAPALAAPTLYTLAADATPDVGTPATYGPSFTREFPPLTATVLRFPRKDAAHLPAPPAPPTLVLLDTDFQSAPAGLQTYEAGFKPTVADGRLQLTSHQKTNTRTAVVFNGDALTVATERVRAQFGFKVTDGTAEGFVFGAYSGDPGTVGDGGQALGFYAQPRRLWGVKIDHNPREVGVVADNADYSVAGWASQPLPAYEGKDMYAVVEYNGGDGTVRARIYQGRDESGELVADVSNRLGNPAKLPVGAVFGFSASTGGNGSTQNTYIENLRITQVPAGVPLTLDDWNSDPWNVAPQSPEFSAAFKAGGAPVTFYFEDARTDVNVNMPTMPDFSRTRPSFFGFERTGFGVGDTTTGRFDRGESFSLRSNRSFTVESIFWREAITDKKVHIQWTSGGTVRQHVFPITHSTLVIDGVTADANTPVIITNVSATSTKLGGRLRVGKISVGVFPPSPDAAE